MNCKPQNIAFTYNATDAYARALSSVPFEKGDVILTTDDDYISNMIAFISLQKRFGIKIVRAKNDENEQIILADFEAKIKAHHPKLVSVTHIPTNSGLIQNVEGVGALCEKYDVLYLVDACQSVGQMPLDVQKIKCDFLSATGRKFLRGPRGTGFLFVSDKVLDLQLEPLMIDMRGANWTSADTYELYEGARRFEMWEFSYSHLLGLAEAIHYANELGMDNIYSYNQQLNLYLKEKLLSIPDIQLFDKGHELSSLFTLRKKGHTLKSLSKRLSDHNVFFSIANKNSAIIDFGKKGIDWAIRISPHYFNTMEEADQLIDILSR